MRKSNIAIVADIGGTNARFACVDLDDLSLSHVSVYSCADFVSLDEAILFYQREQGLLSVQRLAIALAALVAGDTVTMTNLPWQFSISELRKRLEFTDFYVVNDFVAQAMSLPHLSQQDMTAIGEGNTALRCNKVILGAGTGLGVAYLVATAQGMLPVASEAGHMEWAVQTEQEWYIKQYLAHQNPHVSVEQILSGPGLENLYGAIAAYQGQKVEFLPAAEITDRALKGTCALAFAAVDQFLASLGSYAADLAFSLNTLGGVYLAGGIIPRLMPLIAQSQFRTRFEMKARYSSFDKQLIATYVITAPQSGLVGAAAYLLGALQKEKVL